MAGDLIVRSPYDGTEVDRVPAATAADVDRAVAAGRRAMAQDPMPAWRRAEILDAAAAAIATRRDELTAIIAREAGKPIRTARVEVDRAVSTFTFSAVEARSLTGELVAMDASEAGVGKLGFTLRVPVGVVGAISPFNFPLNLVAHKVAPAIAAGCAVVLKPASQTPRSALALRDVLLECGLPEPWFTVVPGSASEVGNAIVDHPDVPYLTFTGSPDVGWGIKQRAFRKRVGLELGNNAPVIVTSSADVERAASAISVAAFSYAGQSCISTQRVYVHDAVARAFVDALVPKVESLVVGDPLDEATDVSSLIAPAERDRVVSWIDEAVAAGAEAVCGRKVDGTLLWPTVLTGVRPDMRVSADEVFGPVVGLQRYAELDEAIALANDTRYGLQAAIYSNDLAESLAAVRALDFGGVLVNEVPTWRTDQMPYGGVRDSGNTREGPAYAVREMTERRLIVIQP